jgi:hypothetical protein
MDKGLGVHGPVSGGTSACPKLSLLGSIKLVGALRRSCLFVGCSADNIPRPTTRVIVSVVRRPPVPSP